MTARSYHPWIAAFALCGVLLSGYLSYRYYFTPGCSTGPLARLVSCSGNSQPVLLIGQPTCVYGLAMFLLVLVLNFVAWARAESKKLWVTLAALGTAGTLFAGGLMIYELFVLRIEFTTVPACVYGLVFYLGILITSMLGLRKVRTATSSVQ